MQLPILFFYSQSQPALEAALGGNPFRFAVDHEADPSAPSTQEVPPVLVGYGRGRDTSMPAVGFTAFNFTVLELCHQAFIQFLGEDFAPLVPFWRRIRHFGTENTRRFLVRPIRHVEWRRGLAANLWCRHELHRHAIEERAKGSVVDVSGILVHVLHGIENASRGSGQALALLSEIEKRFAVESEAR